ncbi:hypothetical protein KDA_69350 [Dictyobacter alpinus]|uniref:Uncharacterized protein n=1 Tax=Dictyobacter alpinus TaxID=2014873 RepID=A0A402BJC4_9CHLR|nr:hypothetical protein KDA_69350 [Dictyobacter alpinus]
MRIVSAHFPFVSVKRLAFVLLEKDYVYHVGLLEYGIDIIKRAISLNQTHSLVSPGLILPDLKYFMVCNHTFIRAYAIIIYI